MQGQAGDSGRGTNWRAIGWGSAAFLLLLPLAAMQVSEEVAWSAADFVFMAILVGSVGLGLELAARKGSSNYSRAAAVALAAAFLLVWINGAVGIIGSEDDDANLLFAGVLGVALLGAIAARLRPAGMAWAMAAAALAQASVPLVAATVGPAASVPVWSGEVLALTGAFTALWLLSAALFRRAAV